MSENAAGQRNLDNAAFALRVQHWLVGRGHQLLEDGWAGDRTAKAWAQEVGLPVPFQRPSPAPEPVPKSAAASCWSERDLSDAAAICGATPRHVRAVAAVEAPRGPFDDAGAPTMLFERHVFHRLTDGRFDDVAPDLSSSSPGGYGVYSAQPGRLARARKLDDEAAVKATSWGSFQIMGFNHEPAGFESLAEFEGAMRESPRQHLLAFARFLKSERLAEHLLAEDWHRFAAGYNGKNYASHGYHTRLAAAFERAG